MLSTRRQCLKSKISESLNNYPKTKHWHTIAENKNNPTTEVMDFIHTSKNMKEVSQGWEQEEKVLTQKNIYG